MPIFQETRTTEIEDVLEPGRGGSRARSGGRRGGARFGTRFESARVSEVQGAIQQAPYGTELSSEELAAHRAVLLSQKQVDLESTIDRHDDMVRRNSPQRLTNSLLPGQGIVSYGKLQKYDSV